MVSQQNKHNKKLTVITTHINADFDAVASMLAAQKLYPDSLVVFPGSQEKNLRNFFINSLAYLFNMAEVKDIDFSLVSRLVVVDTRQANRIGKLAALLDFPDIEIHLFDHHPDMASDIKGHYEVIRQTGATVTILTELIISKGIEISPEEATVMCLGIYEDTGSFTFTSTTASDLEATAILLTKGANLNVVSDLITREISPKQVALLNEMIQAAVHYNINGVEVLITTVSVENYIADFAFLVHKLIKMENMNAIFAIARMANKIYIVARSRIPQVDVGDILAQMGGGGHTFAAAATIKEKTLVQTEHQLIDILYARIRSWRKAKDLMSAPAIMIEADVTCKEANTQLTRYNINALLVTDNTPIKGKENTLVGYITRQVIEKALYHQLDHVAIREYMTTEMTMVTPEADLSEVQEKIIGNKQRILPVIEGHKVVGVVTRTDLLNILVRQSQLTNQDSHDPHQTPVLARTRHVLKFMKERIPQRLMHILERVGEVAEKISCNAYVVGGFVRDLFLYSPNEDIDIVVEGDGIAFAKEFAKIEGTHLHTHAKFRTAVIIFPDGFKIDVASARLEYYKFPAALPDVEMSSIKLDLFRRDFTVNTLAIWLNPHKFGTLIDFFSALKDIKEKVIRVIHNLSFVEDPTRVFRAIRFEQRFGFTIGKLTTGLIENSVKMDFFKRLSGKRVFNEMRLILEEENPIASLKRLHDYDLLSVIHPSIVLNKDVVSLLYSVKKVLSWYDLLFLEESYMRWTVYFLALIRSCDRETIEEINKRLELPPRFHNILTRTRFEAERCLYGLEKHLPVKNSTLFKRLAPFSTELILYMMAAARKETVKKAISKYVTRLRHMQIAVKGRDIKSLGVEPGPVYREILQTVLDAKLNGKLKTREEELKFIQHYVRKF